MTRSKRLGRGLEALLSASGGERAEENSISPPGETEQIAQPIGSVASTDNVAADELVGSGSDQAGGISDMIQISVNMIDENPFQPRREFNESEIASLSASLKEHDMLQPVLVRRHGDRYQLISGERRLRAAIRAGWVRIPARVREADDRLVAELAIVENLQRKDLNPIEKALSFRRYIDEHGCTQEDLARRLKIDRSTLTNLMRLLELPSLVQDSLRQGLVTAGHARALLPLGEPELQIEYCNRIQRDNLSVRQVEQLVSEFVRNEGGSGTSVGTSSAAGREAQHPQIDLLQKQFKLALGTRVDIRSTKKGSGRIVIHFQNPREFERLQAMVVGTGEMRQDAA